MDFLFESDRLRVPVHTLSGGERNRLLLAKLFTMPSNLLVLDEPTNDLDVETLELLEELLASYSGTVLMVSHDREFLDNLVTTTLALEGDGQVREYVGGYTDWLRQRPEPVAAHTDKPKPKPLAPPAKIGPRKLTFKEQRELQMLKDELEALPGKMAALEDEQHTLEDRLNDPGFFARDPDGFTLPPSASPSLTTSRPPLSSAGRMSSSALPNWKARSKTSRTIGEGKFF